MRQSFLQLRSASSAMMRLEIRWHGLRSTSVQRIADTPSSRKNLHFDALVRLGLSYYNFALPERGLDCLLWHSGYLPEILLQLSALEYCWRQGARCKKLVFLGAAQPVGECDLAVNQMLIPRKYTRKDVYNQRSCYWHVPSTAVVQKMWESRRLSGMMPEGLADTEVQWIAAEDGVKADGTRRLANTQDTLAALARVHQFDRDCRYGLLTRAPDRPATVAHHCAVSKRLYAWFSGAHRLICHLRSAC